MINVTKVDLPPFENYVKYLKKIWKNEWVTNNGEFVQSLEKKLNTYLNVKNLMLVSNGTIALELALRLLELKGEIITTPFTFAATTNSILWTGFEPVFADIDIATFNIDPKEVERKITKKTKAILAVHVYGNPCYVEELQRIADKFNLKIIYDAAHAFNVDYKEQPIPNYGDISTLSFHATKVFNTIEGGAIIVKNKKLLSKLRLLINHGIKNEEEVVFPGTNAKMNEFEAIMGICNLKNINKNINYRKKIYEQYKEGLKDSGVRFQNIIASKYNYSYMPICFNNIQKRDEIYLKLMRKNIKARKYFFPLTVNFNYFKEYAKKLSLKQDLRISSYIADRILCLPLYSNLEEKVVDEIIDIINKNK